MFRRSILMVLLASLAGCGPNAQLGFIDINKVPSDEMKRSYQVEVYEGSTKHPEVIAHLSNLQATSCKNMTWDPPATKGNALQQLRLKAVQAGANGLINVYFDKQGTDTWGTNCWESVTATGDAVTLSSSKTK